jgi:hypothetical protein
MGRILLINLDPSLWYPILSYIDRIGFICDPAILTIILGQHVRIIVITFKNM